MLLTNQCICTVYTEFSCSLLADTALLDSLLMLDVKLVFVSSGTPGT